MLENKVSNSTLQLLGCQSKMPVINSGGGYSMLNPEHLLTPFEASALPRGPWLVFAPHADDETYGMGGSLLKARDEKVDIHLVVLTDGALGGDSDDLVNVRREEIQQAAAMLNASSLQLWEEPDRGLSLRPELVSRIAKVIEDSAPASVFLPGPLELHPDHRMTAQLVWLALQSIEEAERPVAYSYEIGVQNPVNLFIDISGQRQDKEALMAIYGSQNSENNYEDLVVSLDKGRTFTLGPKVSYAEGFYQFSTQQLQRSLKEVTHEIVDLYF